MPGESKTSKRRLKARERWLAALELRKKGLTFEAIAEELGYAGRQQAYTAVMKALKETLREPTEELRSLEAERLDAITDALWEDTKRGDTAVIDRILKIMERRAKLLGLDETRSETPVTIKGPLVIIRGAKEADDEEEDEHDS
jgi:hypothetical protein